MQGHTPPGKKCDVCARRKLLAFSRVAVTSSSVFCCKPQTPVLLALHILFVSAFKQKKTNTLSLFRDTSEGRAACVFVCVAVRDYSGKAHVRSGSDGPFWLDAVMRACFIAEWIKSSQQLTQGVLSLHWVLFIHLRCRENNKAECYMALPRSLQRYITKPSPACRDFYSLRRPRSALTVEYES